MTITDLRIGGPRSEFPVLTWYPDEARLRVRFDDGAEFERIWPVDGPAPPKRDATLDLIATYLEAGEVVSAQDLMVTTLDELVPEAAAHARELCEAAR